MSRCADVRAAGLIFALVAAAGCASKEVAVNRAAEVGHHRLRFVVPKDWEHLDRGRQQLFRRGETRLSLVDLGPATSEGIVREVREAERLWREGQWMVAFERVHNLQSPTIRYASSDQRLDFYREWNNATYVPSVADSAAIGPAFEALVAGAADLPELSRASLLQYSLEKTFDMRRMEIARQETKAIHGAQWTVVEVWDHVSHIWRRRLACVEHDGYLLALWTDAGPYEEAVPAFEILLASIELLPASSGKFLVDYVARAVPLALVAALLGGVLLGGCKRQAPETAWQPVSLTTDAMFNDVWFADDHNGWMVGGGWDVKGGIIGRTRDGGQTWRFESGAVPGARVGFGAVQFLDSLSGCMLGGDGQIFRTIDGGENWREARDDHGRFSDLHFVDRTHGWAAGTGVVRTVDGGDHWTWAIRGDAEHGYISGEGIFFLDHFVGWMSGVSSLMRTSDGGESWTRVTIPIEPRVSIHLRDVCFADAQHGWVVGENGTILATTDGGSTWSRQSQGIPLPTPRPPHIVRRQNGLDTLPDIEGPAPGLQLMAVRFLDATRGWAIGFFPWEGRSVVLRTVDGGANWVEEAQVPGEELRALYIGSDGRAWAVGDRVRDGASQVLLRRTPGGL